MQKEEEVPTLELGRIGYEAYRESTGGISLASFSPIPEWPDVCKSIQGSWNTAGAAIGMAIIAELKRTAEQTGGKAIVRLAGNFSALVEAEDPEPNQAESTPSGQKPSIGRIVIYLNPECLDGPVGFGAHRCPAVIVHVTPWACDELMLYVMSPFGGCRFVDGVKQGQEMGQWSWPERV